MVWHNDNRSTDGLVKHVVDSKAWAHINVMWPKFATKPYNVRLGLAKNGVNPFGAQSSTWFTWPFMFQVYTTMACDKDFFGHINLDNPWQGVFENA